MKKENNKKTQLKLKRIWCFVLGVVVTLISIAMVNIAWGSLKADAEKCDKIMKHTCSIYELKNYKNK